MHKIVILIISVMSFAACKPIERKEVKFDQTLADELKGMAEVDQIAAYIPQGKYKALTQEQWNAFKDSVFITHKERLEVIFREYGYPGYDLVGKEGSNHFWLMVQHSDSFPDFQVKVLDELKTQVDNKNADATNYALLTDRVNLNTGKKQIFGTQVTYNGMGQAYPRNLADSVGVNERRASVGLPSLEEYLNMMTEMHFEMNKQHYTEKGMTGPMLYKIKAK